MKFSEEALRFLNLGIESEIAAYVFYKKVISLVRDPSLEETLKTLANDEKGHFLTLEAEFDRNVRSECWVVYRDTLSKPGLPDLDELIQTTHKELLARIASLKTTRDILEMALSLEREALALFSDAAARTDDPELKKVFDYLVAFEKGHVQLIESQLART
ncbi:MAG: ferritin family protein [Candidatus Riflebacteria bacterium]|nr:ferritin family protein [Candidatus Riflebacteria bacterium]